MNFSNFKSIALALVFSATSFVTMAQATTPLAKDHSKFLGNIIPHFIPQQYNLLWNQVTAENAGKWGSVESTRNIMSWGNHDRAYKLAHDNAYKFRFHTIV